MLFGVEGAQPFGKPAGVVRLGVAGQSLQRQDPVALNHVREGPAGRR